MKSFELRNMKSFISTGEIDIKPITIFVGKNSSGKSSLIRFPAIIGQTENTSETIEFRGKFIDYGYFDDVIYNHKGDEIEYKLSFDTKKIAGAINKDQMEQSVYNYINSFVLSGQSTSIDVSMKKNNRSIYVDSFGLFIDNNMVFSMKKNGKDYDLTFKNLEIDEILVDETFIFKYDVQFVKGIPQLNFHNKKIESDVYRQIVSGLSKQYEHLELIDEDIISMGGDPEYIIKIIDEDIIDEDINEILDNQIIDYFIDLDEADDYEEQVKELLEDDTKFNEFCNDVHTETNRDNELVEIRKELFFVSTKIKTSLVVFSFLCQLILNEVNTFSNNIVYIGPSRETPKRDYKERETTIDYVGKSGENIGTILKQSNKTVARVSEWFYNNLNFNLKIEEDVENNQFSIMVYSKNDEIGENLPDVGFGISQLLPIITQIYYDKSENTCRTFIIEQPELHLHPSAQANLADLFVEKVSEKVGDVILLETHSEHFIRKMQILIADPDVPITNADVAIYYVDKMEDGESRILDMKISENGQFKEPWPTGFFDKSYELSMDLLRSARKRAQT